MPPLVLATFLLWYALGYRYSTLRRGNVRSVRRLINRYRNGYARPPSGIIDTAIVRGLEIAQQRADNRRRFLDDEFSTFEQEMKKYSVLVKSIVAAAPLAGLLGTVSGMIETFGSLGDMSLFSQSGGIAGGISQALITTQMGLAVAIPGLIVGRILDRRQHALNRELAQIKDILCAEPIVTDE